jgi:hypothetical protein
VLHLLPFRVSHPPKKFPSYVALMSSIIDTKPSSYEEATRKQVWQNAMMEEYNSIMKNDVWEIVPRPEGKSVIDSRWLYKVKHVADGSIEKYKAWFVARGFSQKEGVDYEETFAPVARYTSIRFIMSLATVFDWSLYQMDVKTTFLNGLIEEEVYINQPRGFEVHGCETHVCKVEEGPLWVETGTTCMVLQDDEYLSGLGFTKTDADSNLYYLVDHSNLLVLVLYVDDLILTGSSKKLIEWCKAELAREFDMKDIGLMHYFLGLEVWQSPGEVFLGQGKYAVEILKRFQMMDCKPMATPMVANLKSFVDSDLDLIDPSVYRQLIGSLMYLVNTRPDICFAVNTLSQYMVQPRQVHWVAAKHVLWYLKGTVHFGLRYVGDGEVVLQGFSDSDWAGSASDKKSTSGCCR